MHHQNQRERTEWNMDPNWTRFGRKGHHLERISPCSMNIPMRQPLTILTIIRCVCVCVMNEGFDDHLSADDHQLHMKPLLVVWDINSIFPYIGNSHSNWLIFFNEGETTNQSLIWLHTWAVAELWNISISAVFFQGRPSDLCNCTTAMYIYIYYVYIYIYIHYNLLISTYIETLIHSNPR